MKIPVLFVLAGLAVAVGLAQVDTAWTRRFDGSFDSTDIATAMTFAHGGAYVTGYSMDDDTIVDFATVSYRSDGTSDWFRRFDGRGDTASIPTALVVDGQRNCYVTGRTWIAGSKYDWMTVKHDTDGIGEWALYHSGTLAENDEPRAIAVAPGGGCVVTGAAHGPGGNWDYTTIKYGPDAETLWVAHYDGTAGLGDEAEALAIDTAGNAYVTGSSPGTGTNQDIVTVKYSPAGETLWARRYTGTGGNNEDKATCILVDGPQNVYVGGYTEGWGGGRDFVVIRYSRHGDTLWTRRFNGSANDDDEVVGIGADARGRVYVAGYSGGIGTFADYVTMCLSPLGESLWTHRWDFGGYGNWPTGLAVDTDGNSYITGYGFDPATQYDFHTISLGPDGTPRWQIRYSGYADDWDQPVGIALDAERNVYVAGFSMSNSQGFDYVTVKYVQAPGVAEKPGAGVERPPAATVARGVLHIPASLFTLHTSLFDLDGRKVMSLSPGPNDISGLAPGVYFVREGQSRTIRRIQILR